METPLRTENLTKIYKLGHGKGTKTALNNLNIEVPEGVIFGFLGPNGAGKTTTIKTILDFIRPSSGTAIVLGKAAADASARAQVGYVPEQPYFHKFLKPIEVVSMHAGLSGVDRREIKKRALNCLERAGITEYAETPIAKLSKGLTQRVGIAQALVGDPKLLILDEPTSGLDPIGRRHIRDLLVDLKIEGKTIFLSSHILSEIENVCDIVAVLKKGNLVTCGAPDQVRSSNSYFKAYTTPLNEETRSRLSFLGVSIENRSDCAIITIEPDNIYAVTRAMEEMHLPLNRMETERESLEEAFLRLAA